jgi:hypothetical protein
LGYLCRIQELDPAESLLFFNQKALDVWENKLRWLESVAEDIKNIGVKNWRRKSQDREQWREILEEAKVHRALYSKMRNM